MPHRMPPRRLFKNADRVSSYQIGQSPTKRMKQMSRDHLDVLQNIEFALVRSYRDDQRVDDQMVDAALRACLSGEEPDDPQVIAIVASLAEVREMREDISDDIWRDALRVIEESVRRHSERHPRETSYLDFAAKYIK